jgi:alkylated DNA repair dioxygenase AlkB
MEYISVYPDAISDVSINDILPEVLPLCRPSMFQMLGKEIEMHYVCCLFRLRDREIKNYYNSNMPIYTDVPPIIKQIQKVTEERTNEEYTYVLVNVYRNTTDYLGYHRDRESLDGPVASVSLGMTRRFLIRDDVTKEVTTMHLRHGDLLLMHRGCQRKYKHSVPKMSIQDLIEHLLSCNIAIPDGRKTLTKLHDAVAKGNNNVRVNLTFRY